MYRYYTDDQGKSWPECINGKDLYTESAADLAKLVPEAYVKVGSAKTHAEVLDTLLQKRAASNLTGAIDDSIDKYVDSRKALIAWEVFTESGQRYSSTLGHVWETSVPKEGIILLLRGMKSGNTRWIEQVYNTDLYVLDLTQEVQLVQGNSKIKRGLMIPFETLNELTLRVSKDPGTP